MTYTRLAACLIMGGAAILNIFVMQEWMLGIHQALIVFLLGGKDE